MSSTCFSFREHASRYAYDESTCTVALGHAYDAVQHKLHDNMSSAFTQTFIVNTAPAGITATDLTNLQTWNRYAYVLNNPLNATDPSGLCDESPGTSGRTLSAHWSVSANAIRPTRLHHSLVPMCRHVAKPSVILERTRVPNHKAISTANSIIEIRAHNNKRFFRAPRSSSCVQEIVHGIAVRPFVAFV